MKQNCSNDLIAYDANEVRITPTQQKEMRERRDANRDRLKRGLQKQDKPGPDNHIIQGSYAMKTMTQHPDKEYDIDDGAAFAKDKLVSATGADMTPQQSKEMVRDALIAGGGLQEDPEILKHCVRVNYKPGYHVDIPVYRVTTDTLGNEKMELAGKDWRDSNPREITDWFRNEETKTDQDDGDPQLRRQTRLLKKYSRVNLEGDSPSGLILTVLTAELHTQYNDREDKAFRALLRNLKKRLETNTAVNNPAFNQEELSKPADEEKFNKLIDQLAKTLERLEVLDTDCSKAEAREVWDDVFQTEFFQRRQETEQAGKAPYTPSKKEPTSPVSVKGPRTGA